VDHKQEGWHSQCGKCGACRIDRQIGLEESPDEWVARLVEVFREVRRVLRDDGTMWVEIGDSYNSRLDGSFGNWDSSSTGKPTSKRKHGTNSWSGTWQGAKPKDLLMQPALLAKALRDPYYTGNIKNETDRVWLAATIDAEGCIFIERKKVGSATGHGYERKNDSFSTGLTISATSEAMLRECVRITGEGRVRSVSGKGNQRDYFEWRIYANQARQVLREVYPHLITKQGEARLALGCPSSGDKAAQAHDALKRLHQGEESLGIDFREPETMFEAGWFLRSEIIWARLQTQSNARVRHRPPDEGALDGVPAVEDAEVLLRR
jgi:hypothetical protein